ncbi:hypothetical protein C5167_042753 [Papaver somniferum]|uniref:Uncharacterized protein n=1 Tax=Papaver somniferum TaxID=3469 RepID=A0A4Y7L4R4_PAPSO|nr:hypothetical protein C5167_042753 [Papaver somniferum]
MSYQRPRTVLSRIPPLPTVGEMRNVGPLTDVEHHISSKIRDDPDCHWVYFCASNTGVAEWWTILRRCRGVREIVKGTGWFDFIDALKPFHDRENVAGYCGRTMVERYQLLSSSTLRAYHHSFGFLYDYRTKRGNRSPSALGTRDDRGEDTIDVRAVVRDLCDGTPLQLSFSSNSVPNKNFMRVLACPADLVL